MNIGIGLNLLTLNKENYQQLIFLYLLLKKIKEFNVYIINFDIDINELPEQFKLYLSDLEMIDWSNSINSVLKLNIFVELNSTLNDNNTKILRKKGTKIVKFETSDNYLFDVEDILYNKQNTEISNQVYDSILFFNQTHRLNKPYFEELHKTQINILPFIWDSYFINIDKIFIKNTYKKIFDYLPNPKKNITIFNSNENVYDMSIFTLFIMEKAYNSNKELFKNKIDKIRIMNSYKFKDNLKYLSIVNKLNIKKDGLCTFEDKFNTSLILSKYTDIVVSNQLNNNIKNYYLESFYGHYPVLHNIESLKSGGYHYNDVNIDEASKKLIYIIENHDNILLDYNVKVDRLLNSFLISNDTLIQEYKNKFINIIK